MANLIDAFLPMAFGILLVANPRLLVKSSSPDQDAAAGKLKKIGMVLIGAGVLIMVAAVGNLLVG